MMALLLNVLVSSTLGLHRRIHLRQLMAIRFIQQRRKFELLTSVSPCKNFFNGNDAPTARMLLNIVFGRCRKFGPLAWNPDKVSLAIAKHHRKGCDLVLNFKWKICNEN